MSAPLVTATGLVKEFGRPSRLTRTRPVRAVGGVDLSIRRGEAVGLVGESGSGKSTIGRLLLGLLAPTEGEVRFDGEDVTSAKGAALRRMRRRMQVVFQDPYSSLDPRRRIGAQIADGMRVHARARPSEIPDKVAEYLTRVGMPTDAAGRYPYEFSGGQRQRISIARALSTDPDFIVADEPVSALDLSIQAQIIGLLHELSKTLDLSMLFISHDLAVVHSLCDRVVVLYLGRVMEEGPAKEVFARPQHPYTRALISCAPSFDPDKLRNRILLKGDPPSPANPPSGCVFRTRCQHAIEDCAKAPPPFADRGANHRAACVRPDVMDVPAGTDRDRRRPFPPNETQFTTP